jgi:hypothetical protein
MTQIVMDDRQQRRSGLGAHLAMTAISLAVVGGFLLWQVWPDGGRRSEATPEAAAVNAAAEETMPRGGLAELYGEQEAAARTITEWLYIVESEAQAQAFFAFQELATANIGLLATNSSNVLWFDSDETEAHFWRMQGEGDAVRDHLGLPRLRVVDFRGAAQTTGPDVQQDVQR